MRLTTLTFITAALLAGCGTAPALVESNLGPSTLSAASVAAPAGTTSATMDPSNDTVRPPLPRNLAQAYAEWVAENGLQLNGHDYTGAFLAARAAYDAALTAGDTEETARDNATVAFKQYVRAHA